MAYLLKVDGSIEKDVDVTSLEKMQALVGGYIQMVNTKDGDLMIMDEEGKLKDKPINTKATEMYRYGASDTIVGDVIIATEKEID